MALFYLLTLYCVIRGAGSKRPVGWYFGAIVACGLGMITKESMVTAPVMILLYDRLFLAGSFRQLIRRRKILYAGLAITWLLLIMVVMKKPYSEWGGFGFTGISPWQYGGSQPGVVCHYLRLSFLPYPLCLDYGWPVAARMSDIIPPAILMGVIAVITILGLLERRPIGFAGAWFFLTLAPTSSLIPISDLAFEHRMYLALAAVIVVPVVVLYWLLLRLFPLHPRRRKIIISVILIPVIITLVILTIQRNRDYYSPVLMWKDVVATRPENPRGHYNLGNALAGAGKIDDAIDSYRIAVSLRPGYGEAYYNLALNLEESDRVEEAIKIYRRALELDPESAKTHNNLARALINTGDEEAALSLLRSAIRLNPTISEPRINLANLEARRGDRSAAITRYLGIIKDFPDSDEALYNLAVTLAVDGDYLTAEEYYRKAIRHNPSLPDAHYNLALLLWKRGDESGAMAHLRQTLRIDPAFPEARAALARVEYSKEFK
jgi:protein O-mannosyl-transferase